MPPIQIESIEIRRYALPLDPPFQAAWDPQPRTHANATVVRVRGGGFEGTGSGDVMAGFAGHEGLFLGRDPSDIERHVQVLDNLQFHYGRMWPLEIALWDLMGQVRGQPLWRLLGGANRRVRLYASTGARLPLEARVESVRRLRDTGFPAFKLRFAGGDLEDNLAVARAARRALGPQTALLVDANQAWRMPGDTSPPWSLEQARRAAAALAELDVYWLEEPLHRHAYRELAQLRRESGVRIAGGEGNREFAEFEQYLAYGSLDVFQPDAAWSTGLLRGRLLAERVQAAGALYSPHTWGDGLALLANLHLFAAVSQAPFVEFPYDPPYWTPAMRDFLLPEPLLPESGGWLSLPEAPGLGVQLDWKQLERWRL